jgi:hypothetical protein
VGKGKGGDANASDYICTAYSCKVKADASRGRETSGAASHLRAGIRIEVVEGVRFVVEVAGCGRPPGCGDGPVRGRHAVGGVEIVGRGEGGYLAGFVRTVVIGGARDGGGRGVSEVALYGGGLGVLALGEEGRDRDRGEESDYDHDGIVSIRQTKVRRGSRFISMTRSPEE